MSKNFKRLMKNSLANIVNGFSSVILGIAVSPFLVKSLSIEEFSIWSLLLQIGALFAVLGFGSQVAVGRFIAQAKLTFDDKKILDTIYNAFIIVAFSCTLALSLLLIAYIFFENLMPHINGKLLDEASISFLYVTLAFILNIILSISIGYFIGIERNDIPAVINIVFRTIQGGAIVFFADYGITAMAIAYLLINFLSFLCFFYVLNRSIKLKNVFIRKLPSSFNVYVKFTFGLAVWNVSMFLVSGVDGLVVGRYAFEQMAYFSVALTLVTAYVGFVSAATSPLIQPITRLSEHQRKNEIRDILYKVSSLILMLNFVVVGFLFLFSKEILTVWVGEEYALKSYYILNYLILANGIRLIGIPMGIILVAQGKQLSVAYYPLAEGTLNLILSMLLASIYGVYGVIIGTFLSSLTILSIYSLRTIKMVIDENLSRIRLFKIYVLFPVLLTFTLFLAENLGTTYLFVLFFFLVFGLFKILRDTKLTLDYVLR